ncbi:two-component system histidine kinase PnpS [Longirhabdus pacifica]|uniref:two-component system histidine kinase PnpS n=1 Tax=Longirhabdus pacifica TaxID=2305227 RepID=UPI0010090A1B|nr:ATP-binding protein [Longirhabdus pacifica]
MNRFRVKLTLIFVLLIGASVLVAGVFTAGQLKQSYLDSLKENMERGIRIIMSSIEWEDEITKANESNIAYFEAQAAEMKQYLDHRITFIALDGTVLGDSDDVAENMNNHLDREEIEEAKTTLQAAFSTRYSTTLEQNMLYAAVPVIIEGELLGFVRSAVSLNAVDFQIQTMWEYLIVGLLILFIIAGVVSYRIAQKLTKPLEKIMGVAAQISDMNYTERVPIYSRDEIGKLGNAINTMASSLQQQMKKIKENETRLTSVLENMVSGVVMIDHHGKVALINRAAEEIIGYEADNVLGKPVEQANQPIELQEMIEKCMFTKESIRSEIVIYYPSERVLEVSLAPLEKDSKRTGIVIVLHDISEIRRLENMRSEFVANVSHELKTPITAVKGFAETLMAGAAENKETLDSFLKIIYDESARLDRLIADILQLSKVESKRVVLQFSPIHMTTFMEKMFNMMQSQAEEEKISLTMNVDEEIYVEADEDRLQQIVLNVLSNAINYTLEEGSVHVSVTFIQKNTKSEEDAIEIKIQDTGIGIPKKDLPRIFERFYRVDKARSRSSGGTGLGLSIVKHLIELHHGTISVESKVGIGSTFIIELPVLQEGLTLD